MLVVAISAYGDSVLTLPGAALINILCHETLAKLGVMSMASIKISSYRQLAPIWGISYHDVGESHRANAAFALWHGEPVLPCPHQVRAATKQRSVRNWRETLYLQLAYGYSRGDIDGSIRVPIEIKNGGVRRRCTSAIGGASSRCNRNHHGSEIVA